MPDIPGCNTINHVGIVPEKCLHRSVISQKVLKR